MQKLKRFSEISFMRMYYCIILNSKTTCIFESGHVFYHKQDLVSSKYTSYNHCLKSVQIRSFFWSVFPRIRTFVFLLCTSNRNRMYFIYYNFIPCSLISAWQCFFKCILIFPEFEPHVS